MDWLIYQIIVDEIWEKRKINPVVKNIFLGEIVYETCKRNFLGDDFLHLKRFREKEIISFNPLPERDIIYIVYRFEFFFTRNIIFTFNISTILGFIWIHSRESLS